MSATLVFKFKKKALQIFQWNNADILIDGKDKLVVSWKENLEHSVEPGHHTIQISYQYLGSAVGKASLEIDIKDKEKRLLTYVPPVIVYASGTILSQSK